MMNKRSGRAPGYTLIEIVTVMGIIAVLFCLFAVVGYTRAKARTTYIACCENLRTISTGLQLYSNEARNKRKFPLELKYLTPDYLKTIPTCPAARADTYENAYEHDDNSDNFTLYCEGSHHMMLGFDSNYPQYSYQWGLVEW
ncbi:MAG: type II secretion system protein [Candidatus Eremiobacteraeota bacterium]|nr:type II secretion system protein [Candidatus Eremiobacteraeota bacterium]